MLYLIIKKYYSKLNSIFFRARRITPKMEKIVAVSNYSVDSRDEHPIGIQRLVGGVVHRPCRNEAL